MTHPTHFSSDGFAVAPETPRPTHGQHERAATTPGPTSSPTDRGINSALRQIAVQPHSQSTEQINAMLRLHRAGMTGKPAPQLVNREAPMVIDAEYMDAVAKNHAVSARKCPIDAKIMESPQAKADDAERSDALSDVLYNLILPLAWIGTCFALAGMAVRALQ